jgi:succinyl-CoA synthetase alpha subunit
MSKGSMIKLKEEMYLKKNERRKTQHIVGGGCATCIEN